MCNAFHKGRLDRRQLCRMHQVRGDRRISKVTQGRGRRQWVSSARRQWASSALRQEIPGNDLRTQRCVTPQPMLKHRRPEMVLKLFSLILILIDSETADASLSETLNLAKRQIDYCKRRVDITKQKSTWLVFFFSKSYASNRTIPKQ